MILPFGWPAWAYKLIGAGALIAACMFMVKCYGDSKVAEGQLKERIAHHDEVEATLLKGQAVTNEELKGLKEVNAKNMAASQLSEKRIIGEIDTLERQLINKMAELAKVRSQRDTEIDAMPPASLPGEILDQSRKLAGAPQPPD